MELPGKLLEQLPFNTRAKTKEQMLNVMDQSTHENSLSQPLQTISKEFKKDLSFLTG